MKKDDGNDNDDDGDGNARHFYASFTRSLTVRFR